MTDRNKEIAQLRNERNEADRLWKQAFDRSGVLVDENIRLRHQVNKLQATIDRCTSLWARWDYRGWERPDSDLLDALALSPAEQQAALHKETDLFDREEE